MTIGTTTLGITGSPTHEALFEHADYQRVRAAYEAQVLEVVGGVENLHVTGFAGISIPREQLTNPDHVFEGTIATVTAFVTDHVRALPTYGAAHDVAQLPATAGPRPPGER